MQQLTRLLLAVVAALAIAVSASAQGAPAPREATPLTSPQAKGRAAKATVRSALDASMAQSRAASAVANPLA